MSKAFLKGGPANDGGIKGKNTSVSTAKSGKTVAESHGDAKWATGGSGHMAGFTGAGQAKPGTIGQTKDGSKWAQGGKGHMVGRTGAPAMPSGRTAR